MPAKRADFTVPAARHLAALAHARSTALATANHAAHTKFANSEAGKDNPTFVRVYVDTFPKAYHIKVREK